MKQAFKAANEAAAVVRQQLIELQKSNSLTPAIAKQFAEFAKFISDTIRP